MMNPAAAHRDTILNIEPLIVSNISTIFLKDQKPLILYVLKSPIINAAATPYRAERGAFRCNSKRV